MVFLRLIILALLTGYSWAMGQASGDGLNSFGKFVASSFFVLAPALYLLPTFEAWIGKKKNLTSIALLNFLLGWSVIGWVGALIWAVTTPGTQDEGRSPAPDDSHLKIRPEEALQRDHATIGAELERLAALLEKNLLTREEFDAQKHRLLSHQ